MAKFIFGTPMLREVGSSSEGAPERFDKEFVAFAGEPCLDMS